MVLDPIPQCLPVHIFGSQPQPPTSPHGVAYLAASEGGRQDEGFGRKQESEEVSLNPLVHLTNPIPKISIDWF